MVVDSFLEGYQGVTIETELFTATLEFTCWSVNDLLGFAEFVKTFDDDAKVSVVPVDELGVRVRVVLCSNSDLGLLMELC